MMVTTTKYHIGLVAKPYYPVMEAFVGKTVKTEQLSGPDGTITTSFEYDGIDRRGRLMLREDGSGAVEYYYGKMGEVTKTVRTLIVPNQAIATYITQWKYDSHNRLL